MFMFIPLSITLLREQDSCSCPISNIRVSKARNRTSENA